MKSIKSVKLSRRLVQNLVLLVVLMALAVFFTALNPRFMSDRNFINLARQILPQVLIGCAMTFVINSGAIDLSVGGAMALSAVCFATFITWGADVWMSLIFVIFLGVVVGLVNTLITHGFKLPPIMATMATWIACSGLAYMICNAIPVRDPHIKQITVLNNLMFFNDKVPLAMFVILVVVAIFIFLEKKTVVGKYAISIGGNENAVFLSGISVVRMRMIFYILTGLMAALSGVWQVSRVGSGDPNIGTGMEFSVIAGCILGGVSIKGGDGTITGMLIGMIILTILINGMNMLGVNAFYQQVATGAVILVAVLVMYLVGFVRNSRSKRQVAARN